jgi:hypothetical protein
VTYRLYVKNFIEGAADALAERLLAQARVQQVCLRALQRCKHLYSVLIAGSTMRAALRVAEAGRNSVSQRAA